MTSKSILIILRYIISKLVQFFSETQCICWYCNMLKSKVVKLR